MEQTNFERMIQLATEIFDAHNDPEQIDVNEAVIMELQKIHPSTVSVHNEGDGPVVWILMIPTTSALMNQFIDGRLSEKQVLQGTPPGMKYDALYLCSAMVLEEYRRKGLAKKLILEAIKRIRDDHPIQYLFTWNFSKEGEALADNIAASEKLPLLKREREIKE